MSLLGDVIAIADGITQDLGLQGTVIYRAFIAASGSGKDSWADPVQRTGIVTRSQKMVKNFDGEDAISTAQVVFLDPTVINQFDKITFPDGTTQPIIGTGAFNDDTDGPILTEIYLG